MGNKIEKVTISHEETSKGHQETTKKVTISHEETSKKVTISHEETSKGHQETSKGHQETSKGYYKQQGKLPRSIEEVSKKLP